MRCYVQDTLGSGGSFVHLSLCEDLRRAWRRAPQEYLANLPFLSHTPTATVLGLQVEGERNGDHGFFIDKYTLSYRYRFNALREWLFFEIEPFLEWPRDENFTTTPGIALRIEGLFSKK